VEREEELRRAMGVGRWWRWIPGFLL
jgi:hypothetical protein